VCGCLNSTDGSVLPNLVESPSLRVWVSQVNLSCFPFSLATRSLFPSDVYFFPLEKYKINPLQREQAVCLLTLEPLRTKDQGVFGRSFRRVSPPPPTRTAIPRCRHSHVV